MGVHQATKNLQMNLAGDTTSDQTYISTSQPAEYNNASDCDINTNCNIKNCDSLKILNNNTSSQNCESPTIESRSRNPRRERRPDRAVYVPRHRRLNLSPTDNDNTPSNSINIENNKIISVSTSSSSKVTLQLAINEAEPFEPTKRNSQLCDIELIKENNSTNFNNISKEVKHLSSNNNINNSNKCNNSNNSTGSNIFTISVISDLKSNENSQAPLVTDSKNSPPKQNLNNSIRIEQNFRNQERFKETDIFNMSRERSVKCSPQELNHETKLFKPPLECHIHENISKSKKAYNKEIDDWDALYDDNGDCVDPNLNLSELTINIDKSQINERQKTETSRHSRTISSEEFPHVLEVSNFPVEFKTQDLMMLFTSYKSSGFDIKWVDDTHALAIFSSSKIAAEVLSQNHSFVSLKPLPDATMASRNKARKCAELLQPYRQRPETCVALARRLVTGALGVKLKTSKEELENERRILRNAKEKRILAAKLRDEVWEDC